MKELIKKLVLWAFDNKPNYNKSETVMSNGDIKMSMAQVKLDGYVTEIEFNELVSKIYLVKEELSKLKKENTTTENSDAGNTNGLDLDELFKDLVIDILRSQTDSIKKHHDLINITNKKIDRILGYLE